MENIAPSITPNRKMDITSLQVHVAIISVCMPLFKPSRSSFSLSSIVTTTFGETAVTTRLNGRNGVNEKYVLHMQMQCVVVVVVVVMVFIVYV